jgi:1,4-dihydroxy-2-naphthoate octaprenyltransferase
MTSDPLVLQRLRQQGAIWWRASRPFTLTASIVPVLAGSLLAAERRDVFDPILFTYAMLGSVLIQIATNLANEYYDYVQGLDTPSSLGPAGIIVRGLVSPPTVLIACVLTFAAASILGLAITWVVGWPILAVGIASVLAGYFYTARPLALGYRALGEIEVFVFMGVLMVMASYYVQAREWSWDALLLSLPIGFIVTAILQANNLRDIDDDRSKGRVTHATLLGRRLATYEYLALLVATYASLVAAVAASAVPAAALVALVSVIWAVRLGKLALSTPDVRQLGPLVRGTAALHARFGLLVSLGLLLSLWVGS